LQTRRFRVGRRFAAGHYLFHRGIRPGPRVRFASA
jgi:hypothetical protein